MMESMISSEYRVILMSALKIISHEKALSEPSPNFSVLKKISWLVQIIFCNLWASFETSVYKSSSFIKGSNVALF